MADDANNNNAGNQEEVVPHFWYHRRVSTTIFFQNRTTGPMFFRLCPHLQCNFSPFIPLSSTPLSSSLGLLLSHKPSPSTYYVGNPHRRIPFNTVHPLQPHQSDTHAVIATNDRDGIFLIIRLLLRPMLQQNVYNYAIDAFSSSGGYWFILSHRTHLHNESDRVIIPNSGVSRRRFAYWLTWLASSRSKVMVVRVDTKSSVDPVKYPLLTYLEIPASVEEFMNEGVVRMRLGRLGNYMVGLVVVNYDRMRRVELYVMREKGSVNGDSMDDDAVMIEWGRFPTFLMVDVDPTMEEGAVEVVGPNRMRCREMPWPMKFESLKLEVLLSVGGGRRVVAWESRCTDPRRSRVVVMEPEISAASAQSLVNCGVPHLVTEALPNIATLED